MKVIWKAELKMEDMQTIDVPVGAHMLCAREQGNKICVWYICDQAAEKERRFIAIITTGSPIPPAELRYLGTASLDAGLFIAHVFEHVPQ